MDQINENMHLKKLKEDIETEFNQERERLTMDKLKFAEQNTEIKHDLAAIVKSLFVIVFDYDF